MATEKKKTKAANKNDRIYIRLNEQVKRDFEIVAAYRGLKTSALIHSLIVQTIHKLREEKPEIFDTVAADEKEVETKTKTVSLKLSERLIAGKNTGNEKTFTTGDGKTFLLVEEGKNNK